MNTRLQVEHPVTELVTGLDLVEWQLRVANGEKLPLTQSDITLTGAAIEVRFYAEDPGNNFLPQTGSVLQWQPADIPGVRIDHGMYAGGEVSPHYDPMVAKVIAYGKTRTDAARLLARAVEDSVLLGVNSNKQFLVNILRHPVFVAGDTSTAFIESHFADDVSLKTATADSESLAIAAALILHNGQQTSFSTGLIGATPLKLQVGEKTHLVDVRVNGSTLSVTDANHTHDIEVIAHQPNVLNYQFGGVRRKAAWAQSGDTLFLDRGNGNLTITNITHAPAASLDTEGDGVLRAPMDGAIVSLLVSVGDKVQKGQTLAVMEAMKIEHQLKANRDGTIENITMAEKQQVKKRQQLLTIKE